MADSRVEEQLRNILGDEHEDISPQSRIELLLQRIIEEGGGETVDLSMLADGYDATSAYSVGDYILKDNKIYKCNTAIATAEEWTAAHWTEVKAMNEVKALASIQNYEGVDF